MRTVWSVAATKEKFICTNMTAVKVVDWKE